MNSVLKYLLFGIIVSVITLFASQNYFKQQSLTFEDCVISNIKNLNNTSVIDEIKSMCKKKFNIQDEVLNNENVKQKMNELFDLFEDMKKEWIKINFIKSLPTSNRKPKVCFKKAFNILEIAFYLVLSI